MLRLKGNMSSAKGSLSVPKRMNFRKSSEGGGAQWQTFGLYVEMAYLYILVHFWSTNMIAVMKADELSIDITL